MTSAEFLADPLELHFILHSQIGKYLAREKLAIAWGALVPHGVIPEDEWKEKHKVAYPEMEKKKNLVSPKDLLQKAKSKSVKK